jgi:hypothetical protein
MSSIDKTVRNFSINRVKEDLMIWQIKLINPRMDILHSCGVIF